MAQFSIALAIFVVAIICVYVIERAWFRQEPTRAALIALFVGSADPVGAILVLLLLSTLAVSLVPFACLSLTQRVIFGQRKAAIMQPAIFLRRACRALSTALWFSIAWNSHRPK